MLFDIGPGFSDGGFVTSPKPSPLMAGPSRFIKRCTTQDVHGAMQMTTVISYDADFVRTKMGLDPISNYEHAASLDRHVIRNFVIGGVLEPGMWQEIEEISHAKIL